MTLPHRESVSVPGAGAAFVIHVTDDGEAYLDLTMTLATGGPPVLVNRMPIPALALGQVGELLRCAAEQAGT